jgi:NAD(P)-dependent dehydrogenase (short-subunit alcohol dehydrogenase family)
MAAPQFILEILRMTASNPPSSLAIIVTGGGRGLGYEMAYALLQAGHRVLITGARAANELKAAQQALQQAIAGADVVAAVADVSRWEDCERVVQMARDRWGRIDGLVNNAARGMREISERYTTEPALFWQSSPEACAGIVHTNVTGTFLMARACVPHMVAQGFGRVVNISTSAVTMVRKGYWPYGPSKAALEAMSAVWVKDLAGTGVTVNVLLPGGASDTQLLPGHGGERRGADGQLLSPTLMRAPIVWLMSPHCEVSGRRFIAKQWRDDLPPHEAAALAHSPAVDAPAIL